MEKQKLIAYEVGLNPGFEIHPASPRRDWMDQFPNRQPYRCLPLAMANQAGWMITSPATVQIVWNGGVERDDTKITPAGPEHAAGAAMLQSHFGKGIVTFLFPWLFKTPAGIGMWVNGPSNFVIPNLYPYQGIVETDWNSASFTMNWQVVKRNVPVFIKKGDPICMITPYPMGLLESFEPCIEDIRKEPEFFERMQATAKSRHDAIKQNVEAGANDWERHYMQGRDTLGFVAEDHRTNFKIMPFVDNTDGAGPPPPPPGFFDDDEQARTNPHA